MIHSFIITGFLGVGKSTMLLNTMKEHFKDKNIAVIVNELGEVGIDHNILNNAHSQVVEITEGCICCSVGNEFEHGVEEIQRKYNPEIIFVETSGAAEPFPVFMSLQKMGISIEGVICVVDAKNYQSYIHNPTAKHQLGGSNIIVLNKLDLVDDEELEAAKKEIIELKNENNLKNEITGHTLFKNFFVHSAEQGLVPKEVFEGAYQVEEIIGLAKDYHQHDPASHDLIDRDVVKIKEDVVFSDIEKLLESLPKNIYRVKGIVKAKDMPVAIIFNHSFGYTSFEELEDFNEKSVLVFIGEKVNEGIALLSNMFNFLTPKQQEVQPSLTQPYPMDKSSIPSALKFKA